MGGQIGQFWQFAVPLTLLAIWALASLLTRDSQPLPPRVGRPSDPNGWNPPTPKPSAAGRAAQVPAQRFPPSDPNANPYRPPARPSAPGTANLESESRRPSPPPQRRPARPKPAPVVAKIKKPVEKSSQPLAGSGVLPPMSPLLGSTFDAVTSKLPHTPLTTAEAARPTSAAPNVPAVMPTVAELIQMSRSPAKVRECLILNELLAPPVCLRRPRFGRRS